MDLKKLKKKMRRMRKIDDVGSLTLLFSFLSVSSLFFLLEKKKILMDKKSMEYLNSAKQINSKASSPSLSPSSDPSSNLKCVSNAKTWNNVHEIYATWQANQWQNWLNWNNWCDWSDWGSGGH